MFFFEESEFEDTGDDQELNEAADGVLEEYQLVEESDPEEPELDITQVDHRLEVAMYYRELLKTDLFAENTPAARVVIKQIRDFTKAKLGELMGITGPVSPAFGQFSKQEVDQVKLLLTSFGKEEIQALALVASKITKKPALLEAKPAKPVIQPVSTPKAPAAPTVAVTQSPKVAMTQVPSPIAKKPGRPKTKPEPQPAKTNPQPRVYRKEPKVEVDQETKQPVLKIGGRVKTVAESTVQPGKVYVKDITPEVKDKRAATPMPSTREATTNISLNHAQETLNNNRGLAIDARLSTAVAHALITPPREE